MASTTPSIHFQSFSPPTSIYPIALDARHYTVLPHADDSTDADENVGFRGRQTIVIDRTNGIQFSWTYRQVAAILRAIVWAGTIWVMLQPILYPIFAVSYTDSWCFFNLADDCKDDFGIPNYAIPVEKIFVPDQKMTDRLNALQKKNEKPYPVKLRDDYKPVDVHVGPVPNTTAMPAATNSDTSVGTSQMNKNGVAQERVVDLDESEVHDVPIFNIVVGGAIGLAYKIVDFGFLVMDKFL